MSENKKVTFGYSRQTITLSGPEDSTLGEVLEALATTVAKIISDFTENQEDAQIMLHDFVQFTAHGLEQFTKPLEAGGSPHVNNTE